MRASVTMAMRHAGAIVIEEQAEVGGLSTQELAAAVFAAMVDALAATLRGNVARMAALDVAAELVTERRRQRDALGWSAEHDVAEHPAGTLAIAAGCYAAFSARDAGGGDQARRVAAAAAMLWPDDMGPFKPSAPDVPRRDLVKAGALILAELERLDAAAERERDLAAEVHDAEAGRDGANR